jgi:predicted CXXCH cytochrome family protein
MGQSIGDPSPQPDGRIVAPAAHAKVTVTHKGSTLEVQLQCRDIRARLRMSWAVGAGIVGRTDLAQVGDYIYQSPVSWYAKDGWDLSPGYENRTILDFDRQIVSGCLFCHAGAVRLKPGTANRFQSDAMTPISCNRCHGDAEAHVRNPVRGTIINPTKLSGAARDSICEQCHLEGEVRILNPGRDWWDFRPGQKTEDTFVTFVKDAPNPESYHAVSQSEQLHDSQCWRASGGQLWCGSCHDPHQERTAQASKVTSTCLSCHSALFREGHHQPASECTHCHMPRLRADNVAHTAITDHRIPKYPVRFDAAPSPEHFRLKPWRDPPREFEIRAEGLALIQTGREQKDPAKMRGGYNLLSADTKLRRIDTEEAKAIAEALLDFGDFKTAERILAGAASANPKDALIAWLRGMSLEKSNDAGRAIDEFRRAIALDPSLADGYLELARLYLASGSEELRKRTVFEFLKVMPQSVRFRLELREPVRAGE